MSGASAVRSGWRAAPVLTRAVQVPEEIGTADAKKVLEAITATGGRAGAGARAALARLKKK